MAYSKINDLLQYNKNNKSTKKEKYSNIDDLLSYNPQKEEEEKAPIIQAIQKQAPSTYGLLANRQNFFQQQTQKGVDPIAQSLTKKEEAPKEKTFFQKFAEAWNDPRTHGPIDKYIPGTVENVKTVGKPALDILARPLNATTTLLNEWQNTNDSMTTAAKKALTAGKTSIWDEQGQKDNVKTISDMINTNAFMNPLIGYDKNKKWYNPKNLTHDVVSFLGSVGLDPASYSPTVINQLTKSSKLKNELLQGLEENLAKANQPIKFGEGTSQEVYDNYLKFKNSLKNEQLALPEGNKLALPEPAIQMGPITVKPSTLDNKVRLKPSFETANNKYNEAIEKVQNYFKTDQLRADEMLLVKEKLGIDLEKLADELAIAEGKSTKDVLNELNNYARMKRVAGATDENTSNVLKRLTNDVTLNKAPIEPIKPTINPYNVPEQYKKEFVNRVMPGELPKPTLNEIKPTIEEVAASKGNLAEKTTPKETSKILSPETDRIVKELDLDIDGANIKTPGIEKIAKDIKDGTGFKWFNQDIYRNFRDAFGKHYDTVKKQYLEPLDNAKKFFVDMQENETKSLKTNIVDKLGIQKGTKDSKLVQQYGEGLINEAELRSRFPKKADKIIAADKWFREQYDRLIDEVNQARAQIYPNNPDKLIPKRKDYYRHFQEMSDTFSGIKNIFETPSQISPSLVGTSEFTKPRSKFLSIAQRRTGNKTKYDAVGGFLDYIKTASYAKHIDPQIPKFRQLAKDIAIATDETKNANNFIGFLQDYANDLAGKTNPADRFIQDKIPGGRMTFRAINALNQRVKANTILGNASSTLSQIANIPQGIAKVKNPIHLIKGAEQTLAGYVKENPIYRESQFLKERYSDNLYRQFDHKLLDQPKKLAGWMLGALDDVGTRFIWNSVHNEALAKGIQSPVKYADEVTRSLVGGRGVGEMPLLQKSKLTQLVMPFTLEVSNLWKVQKDFLKAKDIGGLLMLYLGNYVLNRGLEQVRGNGATFDPGKALQDAFTEKDISLLQRGGRVAGEVFSNIPLGSTLASAYPENGLQVLGHQLPTRKKFFGKDDPTRFGTGLLVAKGLQDPVYKILPPFAGNQIKKTVDGMKSFSKGAVYDNGGDQIRYPVDKDAANAIKGALFGSSAFKESKDFYDNSRRELSEKQTQSFNREVGTGKDPKQLYNTLLEQRQINKDKDKRQEQIKAQFPDKKTYLKKYETDPELKRLNNLLKDKKFKWINEE